jgi:hypothetical protein
VRAPLVPGGWLTGTSAPVVIPVGR